MHSIDLRYDFNVLQNDWVYSSYKMLNVLKKENNIQIEENFQNEDNLKNKEGLKSKPNS